MDRSGARVDPPLLAVASLSKSFGGEAALVGASLTLQRGEVRGLLGANGSGKSTLIKILAGYHKPDDSARSIQVEGEEVDPWHDGGIAGFQFIHQDLALIPELSVVDNVMLGSARGRLLRPTPRQAEARAAQALIESCDAQFSPSTLVRELSAADRTMVAVLRALRHGDETKVLVLDEVTATLSPRETQQVLGMVKGMRHRGVLFVSHRMEEVLDFCDTATILRSGRVVGDVRIAETKPDALIELITGRPLGDVYPDVAGAEQDVVLRARDVAGGPLTGVDVDVHAGELVGVASLDPVESSSLLALIFGSRRRSSGEVMVGDRALSPTWGPAETVKEGVSLVSDRLISSIPSFRVRENLTLGKLRDISGRWRLSTRAETVLAAELIEAFGVAPASPEAVFAGLSGGNQQKVVLGRSMSLKPRLLLLDDPTRGIDVGAKSAIYRVLRVATDEGLGILMASTDFEELASLCHRVVVLKDGRVSGVLGGDGLTAHQLLERCYVAPTGTPEGPRKEETLR